MNSLQPVGYLAFASVGMRKVTEREMYVLCTIINMGWRLFVATERKWTTEITTFASPVTRRIEQYFDLLAELRRTSNGLPGLEFNSFFSVSSALSKVSGRANP